jgi:hypothetical protein
MGFRSLFPTTCALLLAAAFARDARAAEATTTSPPPQAPAGQSAESSGTAATLRSRITDPADGQLDLSAFLAQPRAFLPVPLVVTEPAVGYGLGAVAMFLRPRKDAGDEGWVRPDISALGAVATQNGTWAAFGGDGTRWLDGRLRTLVGAGIGKVNLDFYGLGGNAESFHQAVRYSLDFATAVAQADWQLAPQSPWWIGLRYVAADVQPRLRDAPIFPGLLDRVHVRVSAPTATLTYDSRDNVFTPMRGVYSETSYLVSRESFGSTDDFERFQETLMAWWPVAPKVTLGARTDLKNASSGTPFFLLPYIGLRGVPALRYPGEQALSAEVEARWQFRGRWSLLGFGGAGRARTERAGQTSTQGVGSGGVGFRYQLARRFGLHVGLDLAHSPGTTAVLMQIGSAWPRP